MYLPILVNIIYLFYEMYLYYKNYYNIIIIRELRHSVSDVILKNVVYIARIILSLDKYNLLKRVQLFENYVTVFLIKDIDLTI